MTESEQPHREVNATARTWLLAAVGALSGLGIWWFTTLNISTGERAGDTATTWLWVFATALALTLSSARPRWSWAFSFVAATTCAAITFSNIAAVDSQFPTDPTWHSLCGPLALAIAVPNFQTLRDLGRWSLPYPLLHHHAWSNVIIAMGAMLFVLVGAALLALWGALFKLIGVHLFADTFSEGWFYATALGAGATAGASLLRDWTHIVGALQRVVMSVLAVMTPLLAFALVLFLAFLPVTGVVPLWHATKSTTPIILTVILLAFVLVNTVLGDSDAQLSRSRLLRLAATALGVVIAPLAVLAAASTWLRIEQHGLTPDRCWAVVFIVFALAHGGAYWWAMARGIGHWPARVRRVNVWLALSIGAVALVLALPIGNFAQLSAENQLARLLSGKVQVANFDFEALKFDLGQPGQQALSRLRSITGRADAQAIHSAVARVDKMKYPSGAHATEGEAERIMALQLAAIDRIPVYPAGTKLPPALRAVIASAHTFDPSSWPAGDRPRGAILLVQLAGDARPEAVTVTRRCYPSFAYPQNCGGDLRVWHETARGWLQGRDDPPLAAPTSEAILAALQAGHFHTQPDERLRLFVDNKPVDLPPNAQELAPLP